MHNFKDHLNLSQNIRDNAYLAYLNQQEMYKLLSEKKHFKKEKDKKKEDNEEKADKDYDGDGKVESGKDEYFGSKDKAIKKAIAKKKAGKDKNKKKISEGRQIQCEEMVYGGFPRIIKENESIKNLNESADLRAEQQRYLETITNYGQMLHSRNDPNRERYGKLSNDFIRGKFDNADELIKMGADSTAIGKYIEVVSNPAYQAYMKKIWANADPRDTGTVD